MTFSHHLWSIKCHLLNRKALQGAEGATLLVQVINLVSVTTHNKRAELVWRKKKEKKGDLFITTEKKMLAIPIFTRKGYFLACISI